MPGIREELPAAVPSRLLKGREIVDIRMPLQPTVVGVSNLWPWPVYTRLAFLHETQHCVTSSLNVEMWQNIAIFQKQLLLYKHFLSIYDYLSF